jgi:outer membrane protein assembly factor BamD
LAFVEIQGMQVKVKHMRIPVLNLKYFSYFSLFIVIAVVLAGCSSSDDEKFAEMPVEVLYNNAMNLLEEHSYQKAASVFDEVERQHPYSKWATKAQIMAAYSHYRAQKYERALAALDSFLQLHPAHEDVPYALYLQALCYYEQLTPATRDQKDTQVALETFQDLNRRFPLTDYARDARIKIQLLEDALAGKEMEIGRFYQNKRSYSAAINRFKVVSTKYQTTKHVEEALYRLVECYMALGLKQEAQEAAAVLGHNYPNSSWYAESYALVTGVPVVNSEGSSPLREETWLDRLQNWNKGLPQKDKSVGKTPGQKDKMAYKIGSKQKPTTEEQKPDSK